MAQNSSPNLKYHRALSENNEESLRESVRTVGLAEAPAEYEERQGLPFWIRSFEYVERLVHPAEKMYKLLTGKDDPLSQRIRTLEATFLEEWITATERSQHAVILTEEGHAFLNAVRSARLISMPTGVKLYAKVPIEQIKEELLSHYFTSDDNGAPLALIKEYLEDDIALLGIYTSHRKVLREQSGLR